MIFRLALTVLLLFAQHVALAHRSTHALDPDSFPTRLHQDAGGAHSELCAFHGDFDSILGAAEAVAPRLAVTGAVFAQLPASSGHHDAAEFVVPASRGPPSSFAGF
jgi:hypothetical protein